MALTFQKVRISESSHSMGYLKLNNWDDFGHKTLFNLTILDEQGDVQVIGSIKIGFVGQSGGWTNTSNSRAI
jgi:hypothetical protein